MAADLSGATVGHYRILDKLGAGGMGEVYRAHDETLGRRVALKVLPSDVAGSEESLARFVQEARSASALNHPNVVAIYQIGREAPVMADGPAGSPINYIAMELVIGETLRVVLDRQRPDLKRLLDYLAQAADALAAAHAAGIVHRDFKPDNVMIAEGGYVKVLDFGLAKPRAGFLSDAAETLQPALGTAPGVILGTVGYMSPEQAEGRRTDHRTDIFSFGCVLYEVATGVRAFRGTSSVDTLHRIIHSDPEPVVTHAPHAPGELQRIVRKCLAKDPDARYQTMKDVAIDLRSLRQELDSSASVASRSAVATPPPPAALSRRAWLGIAAGVVVAAALAAFLMQRPTTPDAAVTSGPREPMRIERLTGTGTVIDAVISPDGKYVAYVDSRAGEQALWLRQTGGSEPLRLTAPARVGFWGVQFARDSASIFYAVKGPGHVGGQLFQIPILGGTSRPVLSGIDSAISWSPDGRSFSYLRQDYPEAGTSAVMIADASGANPKPLATTRAPMFFAPGFFVSASWSPDGRRIAAAVRDSAARNARLVTIDVATGAEQGFDARFTQIGYNAWLPDGSGIAFVATPPGVFSAQGGGQIFVQPLPSGEPRRLTNDLVDYRVATFSADGQSLVTIGADTTPSLWQIPLDGREPRKINSQRYDGLFGLAVRPDGKLVISMSAGASSQLAVIDADGANRRVLTTSGMTGWPQITRDGNTIVCVAARGTTIGIWRMGADGSNERLLAAVPDATYLSLAPDDRMLYFTSAMNGASGTWRLSLDGGAPTLVSAELDRAAVSPDGRALAGMSRGADQFKPAVLRLDVAGTIQAFDSPPMTGAGGVVQWTADGTGILYTAAERANLWLQRLSGGPAVRATNIEDLSLTIYRAAPPIDGRTLVVARGVQSRDAILITNFR